MDARGERLAPATKSGATGPASSQSLISIVSFRALGWTNLAVVDDWGSAGKEGGSQDSSPCEFESGLLTERRYEKSRVAVDEGAVDFDKVLLPRSERAVTSPSVIRGRRGSEAEP